MTLDFGASITVKTVYVNNIGKGSFNMYVGDDFATKTACRKQVSGTSWV